MTDMLAGGLALAAFFLLLAVYITCNSRKCRALTAKKNAVDLEATVAVDGESLLAPEKKRGFAPAFWRACAAVQTQGSAASGVSASAM